MSPELQELINQQKKQATNKKLAVKNGADPELQQLIDSKKKSPTPGGSGQSGTGSGTSSPSSTSGTASTASSSASVGSTTPAPAPYTAPDKFDTPFNRMVDQMEGDQPFTATIGGKKVNLREAAHPLMKPEVADQIVSGLKDRIAKKTITNQDLNFLAAKTQMSPEEVGLAVHDPEKHTKYSSILDNINTANVSQEEIDYLHKNMPLFADGLMAKVAPGIRFDLSSPGAQSMATDRINRYAKEKINENKANYYSQVDAQLKQELSEQNIDVTKLQKEDYAESVLQDLNTKKQSELALLERKYPVVPTRVITNDRFATYQDERKNPEAYQSELAAIQKKYGRLTAVLATSRTNDIAKLNPAVDPITLGEEYLKFADRDKYLLRKQAGGRTAIDRDMAQMGVNSLYATGKKEIFPLLNEDEETLDDRFPDKKRSEIYHKIGAELYKKDNWFFNGMPSMKELDEAAEKLNDKDKAFYLKHVRPLEKANTFGTGVPQSGFINQIGHGIFGTAEETGKWLQDITGQRSTSDQAREAINAPYITNYQDVGEHPESRAEYDQLKQKEKETGLNADETKRLQDLSKFTNVRGWGQKLIDGTGNLTGQVIFQAMATKGLGTVVGGGIKATGLLKAEQLIQSATAEGTIAENAMNFGISKGTVNALSADAIAYGSSYDASMREAITLFPDDKDSGKRHIYANVIAGLNAATERIFKDEKILDAFNKEIAPNVHKLVNKLSSEKISAELFQSGIKTIVKDGMKFAGHTVVENSKETLEELATSIGTSVTKSILAPEKFNSKEAFDDALSTITTTFTNGFLVAGMAARSEMKANYVGIPLLSQLGRNPVFTQDVVSEVNRQLIGNDISQAEANEKLRIVNNAIAINKNDMAVTEGKGLSEKAQGKYFALLLNEKNIEHQLSNTTDDVTKSALQKQLDESKAIREGIINKTQTVSEDYVPVETTAAETTNKQSNTPDNESSQKQNGTEGTGNEESGTSETSGSQQNGEEGKVNETALDTKQEEQTNVPPVSTAEEQSSVADELTDEQKKAKAQSIIDNRKKKKNATTEQQPLQKEEVQGQSNQQQHSETQSGGQASEASGSNSVEPGQEKKVDYFQVGTLYDAEGNEYRVRNPEEGGGYNLENLTTQTHQFIPTSEIDKRVETGELLTSKPIPINNNSPEPVADNEAVKSSIEDSEMRKILTTNKDFFQQVKEGNIGIKSVNIDRDADGVTYMDVFDKDGNKANRYYIHPDYKMNINKPALTLKAGWEKKDNGVYVNPKTGYTVQEYEDTGRYQMLDSEGMDNVGETIGSLSEAMDMADSDHQMNLDEGRSPDLIGNTAKGDNGIIGKTRSGKNVYVNKNADDPEYKDFTTEDHQDASDIYNDRRVKYNLTDKAHSRSLEIELDHQEMATSSYIPPDTTAPVTPKPSVVPTTGRDAKEQSKIDKIKEANAKLAAALKKSRGQLNSGLDPQVFIAALESVAAYIDLGVYKFGTIVKEVTNALGDRSAELLRALKQAYIAQYADGNNPDLDDIATVQNYSYTDEVSEDAGDTGNTDVLSPEHSSIIDALKDNAELPTRGVVGKAYSDIANGDDVQAQRNVIQEIGEQVADKGTRKAIENLVGPEVVQKVLALNPVAPGPAPSFKDTVHIDGKDFTFIGRNIDGEPLFENNGVRIREYDDVDASGSQYKNYKSNKYSNNTNDSSFKTISELEDEYDNSDSDADLPPSDAQREFIDAVKGKIINGEKQTIISLRKLADSVGLSVKDTHLQELVELGVVEMVKDVANSNRSDAEKVADTIGIYNVMPTISMRSSQRVELQQYSTPAPMALIGGLFVAAKNPKSVLEPSGGNGMMTVAFDPSIVTVNEIDDVRLDNLRTQGFQSVMNQDAREPFKIPQQDGVVMNPPFGSSPVQKIDGYNIQGLDEQMIVNALRNLAPNGRAAIVMGGHNSYDSKGRLKGDRIFFNYLYNRYNVADVINISGDLYRKQGTSFPTRMIFIDGVKAVPNGFAPAMNEVSNAVVTSFEDLHERVSALNNKEYGTENILPPTMDADTGSGTGIHGASTSQQTTQEEGGSDAISSDPLQADNRSVNTAGGESGTPGGGRTGSSTNQSQSNSEGDSGNNSGIGSVQDGTTNISNEPGSDTGSELSGSEGALQADHIAQSARKFSADELANEKIPYIPKSKGTPVGGSVIPTQMATEAERILTDIDNEYGGIDNYVRDKLSYKDNDALYKAFYSEQIDAIAMAIKQVDEGKGMIIGDMTGIGKGRIAAAMVRYGVLKGMKPVFMTESPNLFSDFYRDLMGIGSEKLVPFMVNAAQKERDPTITDEEGNIVHKAQSGKKNEEVYKSGTVPPGVDFIMATYSQFSLTNTKSMKWPWFQEQVAGNMVIMDESHNVSGDSNRGTMFMNYLSTVQSVVYLSATYAKRPENMPVYALRTSMSEANMTPEELTEAIEVGGVPLQEIVSAQLVESGQMLRRERDFTGVEVQYNVLEEQTDTHRKTADAVTEVVRDIIDFQKVHVNPIIEDMDKEAFLAAGGGVGVRRNTVAAGVDNTPFASKVFNIVDQMLFSIKANEVADIAIEEIKAGRKPVIAFKNTMESFLNDLDLSPGDRLGKVEFSMTLKKGLDGTMRYTASNAGGVKTYGQLSFADLDEEGQASYQRIVAKINAASSGITISPIDAIIKRIEDAGFTVKEMTGRSTRLEMQGDGSAIVAKRIEKDKKKITREFNTGQLDVVMINASAATGISLHAGEKFKDKRQRVMISGQLELDINKEVQKRGRIDRSGQIKRGAYRYVVSNIPSETRLLMMFKKKLKSLDANTTSSQKSQTNDVEVVDFLNKHGDTIVTEYAKENPDFNDKILDPLKLADKSEDELAGIDRVPEAAHKVTGRVAVLNSKDQETFYHEIMQRYNDHIQYLESNDSNDLEVKVLPLNAKTISVSTLIQGKGGVTPFGTDTNIETVEAVILKSPMTKAEIDKEVDATLNGQDPLAIIDQHLAGLDDYYTKLVERETNTIDKDFAEKEKEAVAKATAEAIKEGGNVEYAVEVAKANVAEAKAMRMTRVMDKHERVKSVLQKNFTYFKAGQVYEVPTSIHIDTNVGTVKGVFLGFQIKENRKNPYAPSAITMRFATSDGRRLISIPLSKQDFVNAVVFNTFHADEEGLKGRRENWDRYKSDKTTEHRHVLTGNILQAYGTDHAKHGQLISYTDDQGGMKKGILLPVSYNVAAIKTKIPITAAWDSFVGNTNLQVLETTDGEVSIRKGFNNSSFDLYVPKATSRGGKYFTDPELKALVSGREFNQRGNYMGATVSTGNIQAVLQILQSKHNSSVEVNQKKQAVNTVVNSDNKLNESNSVLTTDERNVINALRNDTAAIEGTGSDGVRIAEMYNSQNIDQQREAIVRLREWASNDKSRRLLESIVGSENVRKILDAKLMSDNYPKNLADRIRSLKFKGDKNAFSIIPPFNLLPGAWNAAVEIAALVIEGGGTLIEATKRALNYVQSNWPTATVDAAEFERTLKSELVTSGAIPQAMSPDTRDMAITAVKNVKNGSTIDVEVGKIRNFFDSLKAILSDPDDIAAIDDEFAMFEEYVRGNALERPVGAARDPQEALENAENMRKGIEERIFSYSPSNMWAKFVAKAVEGGDAVMSAIGKVSNIPGKIEEKTIGYFGRKGTKAFKSVAGDLLNKKNGYVRGIGKALNSVISGLGKTGEDINAGEKFQGEAKRRSISDAVKISKYLRGIIDGNKESLAKIDQLIDPDFYNYLRGMPETEFAEAVKNDDKTKTPAEITTMFNEFKTGLGEPLTEDDLTPEEQSVYNIIKELYDLMHEINYGIGKLKEPTYYANFKKYSARFYDEFELPEEVNESMRNSPLQMDTDLYMRKGAITSWKALHKLQDPVYGVTKRLYQTLANKAIYDYTEHLVNNRPDVVSKTEQKGFTRLGTGYGKLSNKYVRDDFAEDFKGYFYNSKILQSAYDLFKRYDRLGFRQFMKKVFTVYNPGGHVTNIMGNNWFGFLIGINPLRLNANLVYARSQIKHYGEDYRKLLSEGLLGTDISKSDLVDRNDKLAKDEETTPIHTAGITGNVLKKLDQGARDFYSGIDDVYKIAAYKSLRQLGDSHEKAADKVKQGFQNYQRVGKAYDFFSKVPIVGPAFGKFAGDLARIVGTAMKERPLTAMAFLAGLRFVSVAMSEASGEDEEHRRRRQNRPGAASIPMPEFFPEFLGGGREGGIPLNFMNNGEEVNVAKFLSPVFVYNSYEGDNSMNLLNKFSPMPFEGIPDFTYNPNGRFAVFMSKNANDPLLGPLVQLAANSDWRGIPILDPAETKYQASNLTSKERGLNAIRYLGRAYFPHGAYADDLYRAIKNEPDYYGRKLTPGQIFGRFLGYKAIPFGEDNYNDVVDKRVRYWGNQFKFQSQLINSLLKSLEEEKIDQNTFETRANEVMEKQAEIVSKANKELWRMTGDKEYFSPPVEE